MVELGLLVYSVAMSGVWLRTYQGCIREKDDGHLIIYVCRVYDSPKTGTRFGALKTDLLRKKYLYLKFTKVEELNWRWAWTSNCAIMCIKSLFPVRREHWICKETWETSNCRLCRQPNHGSWWKLNRETPLHPENHCFSPMHNFVGSLDSFQ